MKKYTVLINLLVYHKLCIKVQYILSAFYFVCSLEDKSYKIKKITLFNNSRKIIAKSSKISPASGRFVCSKDIAALGVEIFNFLLITQFKF